VSKSLRRYALRKREARALLRELADMGLELGTSHRGRVEVVEAGKFKLFLVDGRPILAERDGHRFPLLMAQELLEGLPCVVVDMGAVPHICNGADVMAPGVVEVRGSFGPSSLVVVRDERHGKAIAIGTALVSSEEIKQMEKGKVVANMHYVGDRIWRLARSLWHET